MSKKTNKKGFQLDGDKKTNKKAGAEESPQARGARTRRERQAAQGSEQRQGKALTKPLLGAVRMTQLKGGAISITVTPIAL